MRLQSWIVAAAVVGLLAPLPLTLRSASAGSAPRRSDILPLKEVKRGMKGYGLTVFEGTKPEKFAVEVIDVLRDFQPGQDLILIKTKHPRLEVAKVVAGMSGSPIYLNNKMIGAYAYGWTFGAEPVAGVTPIENMLNDIERPLPPKINGWPLKLAPYRRSKRGKRAAFSARGRYQGKLASYSVKEHAAQIARQRTAGGAGARSPIQPVTTPLLVGGLTGDAVESLGELIRPLGMEPVQAGGGGGKIDPKAPKRFVDGGAIGVQLIRGDVSAQGLGTVTRVEGDRLVAFGHPMMKSGVTAMPTAVGRVLWFLASKMRSFKIGMPVRPVGALVNDRLASIVVSHSATAPVVPVRLKIQGVKGAPKTEWNFEVAHERFMTPTLVATGIGNAIQAVASERRDVTWDIRSKVKFKGYKAVAIRDFGVSLKGTPGPRQFVRTNAVGAVGSVLNNPWGPEFVERIDVDVSLRFARDILRLKDAVLLDAELDPGQSARVRLVFEPYTGKPITQVIKVPVPERFAGRSVRLDISPGYLHRKQKAPPENVGDLISTFEDVFYPPRSIIVSYAAVGSGLAFRGRVVNNLPPGALDAVRSTASSDGPAGFSNRERHVQKLSRFVVGRDSVTVRVRPRVR